MKYTLEDFKNRKIAVWVRNEEEYRKFCIFARDLKWNNKDSVYNFSPRLPCEIFVILGNGMPKMAYDNRKQYLFGLDPSNYQSVTVDELDLEPEVKIEDSLTDLNRFMREMEHYYKSYIGESYGFGVNDSIAVSNLAMELYEYYKITYGK